MILFKEPQKQREYGSLHPNLRRLVDVLSGIAAYHNEVLVVTEMFRDDPGSVHHYGRGIDLAMWSIPITRQEQIRIAFNQMFPYGKQGVETVPTFQHGTADHWHIQVKG